MLVVCWAMFNAGWTSCNQHWVRIPRALVRLSAITRVQEGFTLKGHLKSNWSSKVNKRNLYQQLSNQVKSWIPSNVLNTDAWHSRYSAETGCKTLQNLEHILSTCISFDKLHLINCNNMGRYFQISRFYSSTKAWSVKKVCRNLSTARSRKLKMKVSGIICSLKRGKQNICCGTAAMLFVKITSPTLQRQGMAKLTLDILSYWSIDVRW